MAPDAGGEYYNLHSASLGIFLSLSGAVNILSDTKRHEVIQQRQMAPVTVERSPINNTLPRTCTMLLHLFLASAALDMFGDTKRDRTVQEEDPTPSKREKNTAK